MRKYALLILLLSILSAVIALADTTQTNVPILNLSGTNTITYKETQLSDGSTSKDLNFAGDETKTIYIRIPKNSQVTTATLQVSGYYECYSCAVCQYDPGTGPDCTCPSPGSGGSCPGGCAVCSYTPSTSSNCECQSPYSGGGAASCYECTYEPSCPDCSCPYGTGGGVKLWECTYTCSRSWSSDGGEGISIPTPDSGYWDWSCSAYAEARAIEDSYCSDGVTVVQSHEFKIETAICTGSTTDCATKQTNVIIYSPSGGMNYDYCVDCSATHGCAEVTQSFDVTESSSTYSCSPGDEIYCLGAHPDYWKYSDTSCGNMCGSLDYEHHCYVDWSYKIKDTSTDKCGANPCQSGESKSCDTGTCSCYACYECTYTPSPSTNCQCPEGYSGGGIESCNSCSYTPPGPDCTCPSPGSGGSCPGGCEICEYTPSVSENCQCQSPYSGGGCSDYAQPENPWIDSTGDGSKEWSWSGPFNESSSPQTVDLNPSQINSWLSTCTPDSEGNCLLPIQVHSDHKGRMRIHDIVIEYNYIVDELYNVTKYSGRHYLVEPSGKKAPVDVEIAGYYVEPTASSCWINGVEYPLQQDEQGNYYCAVSVSVSKGGSWPTHDIIAGYPRWKDAINLTPSSYDPNSLSIFNITWWDESPYEIVEVRFESNYSGMPTNYTMNLAHQYTSDSTTYNVYNYNSTLPAGTFYWKSYAKSSDEIWASSDSFSFSIAKATPALNLLIDGTAGNKYVTHPTETNTTAYENNTGDSDVTYCLYRNGTLIGCGSEVEDIATLSIGTYTYTYNSTEGQNYTSASVSRTLGVFGLEPVVLNLSAAMSTGILWWKITPIVKTEGEYYQIKCSEWGDNNTRCYTECPSCYAEIGQKVRWRKSVVLYNPTSTTYGQVLVNASIPTSTVSEADVVIVNPEGNAVEPSEVDLSAGEVKWLVPSIAGTETQTWTIYFNTTPPMLEKANTTEETVWYLYMNVTGPSDLTYEKVWTYTPTFEPLTLQKLYDYGTESYVTTDTTWGPPQPGDEDSDGYYDFYKWITPSVTGRRSLRLEGVKAEVRCNVTSKIIENEPVAPNENVRWKWTVECRNDANIGLNYEWVLRLPLESQYVKVDGTPVEVGFYTIPPAGPYITLSGYLAGNSTVNRTVTFITPPVTVEVSPPRFPDRFWVGKNASIAVEISARNWASEAVNQTRVKVNIVYGTDVKLYKDGELVNETDEVWGYYTFYIYNMSGYDTRNYVLTYKTPVADSEIGRYSRAVINNTQYLVYPVHTWSLAPFPLDPLYQRFEHEEPFTCDDVAFVWGDLTKETYTNPLTASYYTELDFECEGNETVVELLPLSVGEEEYFAIFVVEERPMVPILNKIVFDFFEKLVSVVKSIIEAFIGLFSPLMGG